MYTKHKWESDTHYNFGYVKYLPKDFDENKKYPLVFFLHGAGERSDDPEACCEHGYMKRVRENGEDFPFIFIAPQCPDKKYWGCFTESLLAFLDYICETLPIDEDRTYLTGLSMGGTGTWMLAMAAPERFAAIAPICGSGICWNGRIISQIPTYIYHGDCDDTVPLSESITMLSAVNGWDGKAQIKICYGMGHNAWDVAYAGDELINWFFAHKREKHD